MGSLKITRFLTLINHVIIKTKLSHSYKNLFIHYVLLKRKEKKMAIFNSREKISVLAVVYLLDKRSLLPSLSASKLKLRSGHVNYE